MGFNDLPLLGQLAVLAVVGLVMGVVCNQKIYRWAHHVREIDPWGEPPEDAPPRVWSDRLPIVGWFGLSREEKLHGDGFWIRPMLIEIAMAAGVPALYWWEMQGGLYPADAVPVNIGPPFQDILQAQFLAHLLLLPWLVIATFIDFDEQTIPYYVTLPATIIGLALAGAIPTSLLPNPLPTVNGGWQLEHQLLLTDPGPDPPVGMLAPPPWPQGFWLDGSYGLALGLACFAAWCLFERDPLCTFRRGPVKGVVYWCVTLVRRPGFVWFVLILLAGSGGIVGAWTMGSPFWPAMLSALVGAAVGAGATWVLRLVSNQVLGVEALGYGDVTLMAMIGAFLGWQPAIAVLGMGPILGIGFALANAIFRGRADICFGPFLCAGVVIELVAWRWFWFDFLKERIQQLMTLPWQITLTGFVIALGLFAVLLPLARWIRRMFMPDEESA